MRFNNNNNRKNETDEKKMTITEQKRKYNHKLHTHNYLHQYNNW